MRTERRIRKKQNRQQKKKEETENINEKEEV